MASANIYTISNISLETIKDADLVGKQASIPGICMTCQAVHRVDHACQFAAITHSLWLHLQCSAPLCLVCLSCASSFLPHSWLAADCPGHPCLQDPQIVFHHSGTQKVKTSVAKSAGVSARWSETVDLQVSHRACL